MIQYELYANIQKKLPWPLEDLQLQLYKTLNINKKLSLIDKQMNAFFALKILMEKANNEYNLPLWFACVD